MYQITPQARTSLAQLMHEHTGRDVSAGDLQLIAAGASGRAIVRHPQLPGIIGIYWTAERADNHSFVPAARGLAKCGVKVPSILAEADCGNGCGACLVQDLGTQDILSLKGTPWTTRIKAYKQAIQAVHSLHSSHPDWELQPGFDAALYRWEQCYFAEHYLQAYCAKNASDFIQHPAMVNLAEFLAEQPTSPIHRDFQSQNIMLYQGEARLIDFQGMRAGLPEYDMASLLLDPYMELSSAEQAELLLYWEHIRGSRIDRSLYAACALQRIMQALGAYANIGLNQHKEWYLNLIPAGLRALKHAMSLAPAGSPASHAAACLQAVL